MNIWFVSYGTAIIIGYRQPTDYPSNFAVFLLLCIGAVLTFAWLVVTVVAIVREGIA